MSCACSFSRASRWSLSTWKACCTLGWSTAITGRPPPPSTPGRGELDTSLAPHNTAQHRTAPRAVACGSQLTQLITPKKAPGWHRQSSQDRTHHPCCAMSCSYTLAATVGTLTKLTHLLCCTSLQAAARQPAQLLQNDQPKIKSANSQPLQCSATPCPF